MPDEGPRVQHITGLTGLGCLQIEAGGEASFTEEWHLLPMDFPAQGEDVDLAAFTARVEAETGAASGKL